MSDLISIIINVYNGENFIAKCLDSIITQTYKNLEILIINDGSTDNTLNICKSYKDKRIRIITTPNFGLSKSRNIGIENARGRYLYFIDSDDFIEIDTIDYLYSLCKKYNTKLSTCQPITIFDYNYVIKNNKEKVNLISNIDMLKKVLLSSSDRAVTIWNKLIDKELFYNLRFEDRPINDIALTYKLVLLPEKISYSNQIKYYYLKNKNSITVAKKQDYNRLKDKYDVSVERYNYIKEKYPNLVENEISLLRVIPLLYCEGPEELCSYLIQQNALKLFKKLFSLKVFFYRLKLAEKIRIFLFRINHKMCRFINNKYQSIKYKYRY